MSTSDFSVFVDIDGAGSHPAAGQHTSGSSADPVSAAGVTLSVRAAERAGFTAVTFHDHPLPRRTTAGPAGRIDAVLRASFSAPLTSAIGLVPVVHSLYGEPFHVATQLASLDTASHGRAGWIVAGDPDPLIAARHGREPLSPDLVDDELVDVVEAVRRLWDSWDDDAVIRDVATGRFFDRDRLHYADFEGARFSVKGSSIVPRSPQGQSVVVGTVGTRAEIDVALVDGPGVALVGTGGGPLEAGSVAALTAAARSARATHGDDVRLLLQLEAALDRAGRTGAERLRELDAASPWRTDRHARYVGDADGLALLLETLAGDFDGVRILPATLDDDLDEVGRAVLPALRATGVFRSPRSGDTLRQSLGFERPANRFAGVSR